MSVLEHLLGEHLTVPPERGVFLDVSYRMHPDVCSFVSALAYEDRLRSQPETAHQRIDSPDLSGAGIRFLAVEHADNAQASPEETGGIAQQIKLLLSDGWVTRQDGSRERIGARDILVVAAYNHQVSCLRDALPAEVRVGTVDKFQGQEAPVVFYSMAASSAEDAPRGVEFLFSRNRLNVAVSRAQALAILVASPTLLDVDCRTVEQMRLANGVCRFVEQAAAQAISD